MGSVAKGAAAEAAAHRLEARRRSAAGARARLRHRPTDASSPPIEARWSGSPGSPARARPRCSASSSMPRERKSRDATVEEPVALVAGDRQTDGIFPLWSIAKNITVGSMKRMLRGVLIDPSRETEMAETWRERINIRTPDHRQQHPLAFRRQPAEGALRPRARLGRRHRADGRPDARRRHRHQAGSLRHDPRRGGGRAAPSSGTRPRWTSCANCDHVYVFRNGRIVADLAAAGDDRGEGAAFLVRGRVGTWIRASP